MDPLAALIIYFLIFVLLLGLLWYAMAALELPGQVRMMMMILGVIVGAIVLLRAGGLV
jgi:hypothetical protein